MKRKIKKKKTGIIEFLKEMYNEHKVPFIGIAGALGVLILGGSVAIIVNIGMPRQKVMADDVRMGVQYIKTLETMDTNVIENRIKEIRAAERKAAFESGEMDVWAQFSDSIVMGDSRAVGFYYFGFMDSSRVFAEGGATIRDIEKYSDQIQSLNPESIFLSYGLNDISIGYWETAEEYVAEYDEKLAMLKNLVPDTDIYVILTIPATDPAFDTASIWRNIPDWNVVMEQHFSETGTRYIDVSDAIAEHSDLYDEDGIHLQKEFYNYWAIDILSEVMEYE